MADRPRHIVDRIADRARLGRVGHLSPGGRFFFKVLGPLLRLSFRPSMTGWDHVPADRPFLVVSNHSGTGASEVLVLYWLWLQKFKGERPVTGLAHPLVFVVPGVAVVMRAMGILPSTYRHAAMAFEQGVSMIIFPGGDYEAFRPFWKAREVDFNNRKGFLKIARRAKAPIVPLGVAGSHFISPVLWRSRLLPTIAIIPRLIGLKRLPVTPLMVAGCIGLPLALYGTLAWPWLILVVWLWINFIPMYFFPLLPWTVRARIGPPIEAEDLFGDLPEEGGDLQPAYDKVVAAIQAQINQIP